MTPKLSASSIRVFPEGAVTLGNEATPCKASALTKSCSLQLCGVLDKLQGEDGQVWVAFDHMWAATGQIRVPSARVRLRPSRVGPVSHHVRAAFDHSWAWLGRGWLGFHQHLIVLEPNLVAPPPSWVGPSAGRRFGGFRHGEPSEALGSGDRRFGCAVASSACATWT